MATKSILKNIEIRNRKSAKEIRNRKSAKGFVYALDRVGEVKAKSVTLSKQCKDLGREEIIKIFGVK